MMIESFWQIMLFVGLLLIALEAFAPGFILLPVGVAFVLSSGFSFFLNTWTQVLAVLAINIVLVFMVFWLLIKPRLKQKEYKTNAQSMIGAEVVVVKDIASDTEAGLIKLYGDDWRALNAVSEKISSGQRVRIVSIEGNKVIVRKLDR